jgi:cbb3-type cytochrome c oxidase subunit III
LKMSVGRVPEMMNKRGKILTSEARRIALCAVAVVLACASVLHAGISAQEKAAGGTAQTPRSESLFAQNCARCHGASGHGETELGRETRATDLARPAWRKRVSDKRIIASITDGRGRMPAFGKRLSKDEIAALTSYVHSLGE